VSGDVFSVISDVADPAARSGLRGQSTGFTMTKTALAKPVVQWRDYFLTLDIYEEPGGSALSAHLYCPLCAARAGVGSGKHNALMIRQTQKRIEVDFNREPRFHNISNAELLMKLRLADKQPILQPGTDAWRAAYREAFPLVSIETFKCAWEGEYGLCTWRVQIDNNIARDV
jgi:hypothetical protein